MKSIERKPRRIAIGVLAIIVIAIMWIKKDVLGLWSNISSEDLLPLLATNAVVIIVRIAILAGIIYLIRKLVAKIRNKKTEKIRFVTAFGKSLTKLVSHCNQTGRTSSQTHHK